MGICASLMPYVKPAYTVRSQPEVSGNLHADNCHACPAVASGSQYVVHLHLSPPLSLSPENPLKAASKAVWQHPLPLLTQRAGAKTASLTSTRKESRKAGLVN